MWSPSNRFVCVCVCAPSGESFFFVVRFRKNVLTVALRAFFSFLFLIKMYNVTQLLAERVARERLHGRQRAEAQRRERVFNDKVRTIGVSLHLHQQELLVPMEVM